MDPKGRTPPFMRFTCFVLAQCLPSVLRSPCTIRTGLVTFVHDIFHLRTGGLMTDSLLYPVSFQKKEEKSVFVLTPPVVRMKCKVFSQQRHSYLDHSCNSRRDPATEKQSSLTRFFLSCV